MSKAKRFFEELETVYTPVANVFFPDVQKELEKIDSAVKALEGFAEADMIRWGCIQMLVTAYAEEIPAVRWYRYEDYLAKRFSSFSDINPTAREIYKTIDSLARLVYNLL